MEKEVKDIVDKLVSTKGISHAKLLTKKMLEDSIKLRDSLQKSGKPVLNTSSHIQMSKDILNYLDDLVIKQRDEKLSKLLGESKVYSFTEFSKLF